MALFNKSFFFNVLALAFAALTIEAGSQVFFKTFVERFTFYDISRYTLEEKDIARISAAFDKDLGWKHVYKTPYGERPRGLDYKKPIISTFGDSFVYGGQVKDQETFQEYLSGILKLMF